MSDITDAATFIRRPLGIRMPETEVLRRLRNDRAPFALVGEWAGGGAVLGSEPTAWCDSVGSLFSALGKPAELAGFRPETWRACSEGSENESYAPGAHAPFGGGWVGWLGYGAAEAWQQTPPAPGEPRRLSLCSFAYYDHVLRADSGGEWFFEALVTAGRAAEIDERLVILGQRMSDSTSQRSASPPGTVPKTPLEHARVTLGELASLPAAADHEAAVARCVELIARGDLLQANLCMRFEGVLEGDPLELFCEAIDRLHPPYAAFVARDEGAVVSLSPELFLRRLGRTVTSRPIKGTARRNNDPTEAGAQRRALESSAKDRAENVMIVDLVRNDLGRVCTTGSVRVTRLCVPEPHPGVWHLVSEVTGELCPPVGDAELIRATFPPGSITGAPKIRAMEVIHELEASPREIYTGSVGYRSPVAGLELNVAIRTFECASGRVWLGAGGGIVADSAPASELAECFAKVQPLVEALGGQLSPRALPGLGALRPRPAKGVFTTLRVTGGVAWHLEAHLGRLDRSCRELYGKELPASTQDMVDAELARLSGRAEHDVGELGRLRISVRPVGGPLRVSVELSPWLPASEPGVALHPVTLAGGLGAHKWSDRRLLADLSSGRRLGGDDQLLLCDADGSILETDKANLFVAIEGEVFTPYCDGRLLPGVARQVLLSRGLGIVSRLTLAHISRADEAFVTSSLRGVVPVTRFGVLDAGISASRSRPSSLSSGRVVAKATEVMTTAGLGSG